MPQYKTGDMFADSSSVDIVLATSNSYIKQDGCLVMGAGAAKDLAFNYPSMPKLFGQRLADKHLQMYGVCVIPLYDLPLVGIGLFQTKFHWREPSNLDLIKDSTNLLRLFAEMFDGVIAVNYPGVGLGGRTKAEVQPIIELLPSNVWVYEHNPA